MGKDNNIRNTFLTLVTAGLWEKEVQLLPFGEIDYSEVMRLAEEQSVVGLVTAGLEHVVDVKVPQIDFLTFEGLACRLEQQNKAMNDFIAVLVEKMRKEGIYTFLVKGQGIAQCYERPLWRSCGDVDLLLDEENYEKAQDFLTPFASKVDSEGEYEKHLGMTIDSWVVELHGSLYCGLSSRVDQGLDEIRDDVFYRGNVRSWMNGETQIFLLSADNDSIYVFTHILQHFYKGGIGIRQFCDWCRLLWTYRESLNHELLKSRIRKMGLVTEWKAFGAFAVEYLGMPKEAMPLYSSKKKWKRKAERICDFVMEVGNMGHNRDKSYFGRYPYVIRKAISLGLRIGDLYRHARIFPMDSIRFFPNIVFHGLMAATRGE